jgi:hypothetical protein
VKEKRQLKLEKKQAGAARKLVEANGEPMPLDEGDQPDETTAAPPE